MYGMQLTSWWKRKDTEVVVPVIPTQNIGQTIIVHHRELQHFNRTGGYMARLYAFHSLEYLVIQTVVKFYNYKSVVLY